MVHIIIFKEEDQHPGVSTQKCFVLKEWLESYCILLCGLSVVAGGY